MRDLLVTWLIPANLLVYLAATLLALRYRTWGKPRFIPAACNLIACLHLLLLGPFIYSTSSLFPNLTNSGFMFSIGSYLACAAWFALPIGALVALRFAWNGKRPTERVLRVTAATTLFITAYLTLRLTTHF